jgi:hypothetical protein
MPALQRGKIALAVKEEQGLEIENSAFFLSGKRDMPPDNERQANILPNNHSGPKTFITVEFLDNYLILF